MSKAKSVRNKRLSNLVSYAKLHNNENHWCTSRLAQAGLLVLEKFLHHLRLFWYNIYTAWLTRLLSDIRFSDCIITTN